MCMKFTIANEFGIFEPIGKVLLGLEVDSSNKFVIIKKLNTRKKRNDQTDL